MTGSTVNLAHAYVAILRCRTWCQWPDWQQFKSRAYRDPVHTASGRPIYLSLHIATYKARERPEVEAAGKLEEKAGPLVWRGAMDSGYWIGNALIKAPDEDSEITIAFEPPYEGEVDIQLHIGAEQEISIGELTPLAHAVCYSALAFVNLAIGDIMVPVAPVQVRRLTGSESHIETDMTIAVRTRRSISDAEAKQCVEQFIQTRANLSPEEAEALSVAARRFLSAVVKSDSIDRYCDLWEVCEFATLYEERPRGGVVGRIAQALTAHVRSQHQRISKAKVENRLCLRDLH